MPPSRCRGSVPRPGLHGNGLKWKITRHDFWRDLGRKSPDYSFLHCVRPVMFGDIGGSHALDERLCGLRRLPEAQIRSPMHAARFLGERVEWVRAAAEPHPNFL